MQLKPAVIEQIKTNKNILREIEDMCNTTQQTIIYRWIKDNNSKLLELPTLEIISRHLGIRIEDLLMRN